jgi:DNA-binding CsgD family transcriptional regulator
MQGEPAFQERYVQVLTDLSPRIGEILRRSVIAERAARDWASEGPGVVLIGASGEVESLTPQGSRWLAELAELDNPSRTGLPTVIEAMGARLASGHSTAGASFTPRARVRLRSGRWLSLHASPLGIGDVAHRSIAIVIEPASAHDLAPMMIAAYGLTNRETQVAERLIAGMPRKRVAAGLQLSLHTVNDHIKAIYEKLGISSVGQLRMQVLQDHSAVGQA